MKLIKMLIVDAFTHYVKNPRALNPVVSERKALNPEPHCYAYYAYTTPYEHWVAKFGLPKTLVTDNGTEFINNEIITICHLYNNRHKTRTSHAPWTNGLVEGMNHSLQEYRRCIINGNDTRYTECSTDVIIFPHILYFTKLQQHQERHHMNCYLTENHKNQ